MEASRFKRRLSFAAVACVGGVATGWMVGAQVAAQVVGANAAGVTLGTPFRSTESGRAMVGLSPTYNLAAEPAPDSRAPAPGAITPGATAPGVTATDVMAPGSMATGIMAPGIMAPGIMAPGMMAPQALEAALKVRGFTGITALNLRGGAYVCEATGPRRERVRLVVDAVSGEISGVQVIGFAEKRY